MINVIHNEAAVAPGVNDDVTFGFGVGSRWYDTTAESEFVCLDPTNGAAVWKDTTSGGAAGAMLADGSVPWTGTQVPTTTNTEAIGTEAKAFKEILVNIVQPGTSRNLDFKSEDGSVSLSISNNALTVSHRIQPSGNDSIAIGTTSLSFKEFIGNILRPATARVLKIMNPSGAVRIEIDNTGIGFFAGAPVAKAAALTAVDATAIDAVYGAVEEAVLNNVRSRVNDLESRLQAYTLLA